MRTTAFTLAAAVSGSVLAAAPDQCQESCPDGVMNGREGYPPEGVRRIECQYYMTTTVYQTPVITEFFDSPNLLVPAFACDFQPPVQPRGIEVALMPTPAAVLVPRVTSTCSKETNYEYRTVWGPRPEYLDCSRDRDRYGDACQCWGFNRASKTIRDPPRNTRVARNRAICFQGSGYAFFAFGPDLQPPNLSGSYAEYDEEMIEFVRRRQPYAVGRVPYIGGEFGGSPPDPYGRHQIYQNGGNPGCLDIYRNPVQQVTWRNHQYWTLVQAGYVIPASPGDYVFSIVRADDLVLLWVGDNAITNWQVNNANLRRARDEAGPAVVQYVVRITAADVAEKKAIPFRFLIAKAAGDVGFKVNIVNPAGLIILGQYTCWGDEVVASCEDSGRCSHIAPAFLGWAAGTFTPEDPRSCLAKKGKKRSVGIAVNPDAIVES